MIPGKMIPTGIPQHPVETTDQDFDALGLNASIVDAIRKIGFVNPTPIQAAVIPHVLAGRDVIGLAQTGSGKTAAFALPIAERLTHGRGVRGLILSPTREIALQTKAFLDLFGANARSCPASRALFQRVQKHRWLLRESAEAAGLSVRRARE
jgi:superfamily II DNA/RNA helicase